MDGFSKRLLIILVCKEGCEKMILTGKEDLRVRRTIKNIQEAFLGLILEHDYNKITVKALCDKAMINKKTFYAYYPTMDGLLLEMQEMMVKEHMAQISHLKAPEDLLEINRQFFLYSVSKGKIYERIMCSESYSSIGENITYNFVRSVWNKSKAIKDMDMYKKNILFGYLSHFGLELYRQWVRDGKKVSLEEMIDISGELLCNGVNGFIAKNCIY